MAVAVGGAAGADDALVPGAAGAGAAGMGAGRGPEERLVTSPGSARGVARMRRSPRRPKMTHSLDTVNLGRPVARSPAIDETVKPAAPADAQAPAPAAPAAPVPARPADPDGVTLRQLASAADYRACFELELATWGRGFEGAVPPSVLKILQRVGGIVAGAFAADGRLLGYLCGLTGVRPPR